MPPPPFIWNTFSKAFSAFQLLLLLLLLNTHSNRTLLLHVYLYWFPLLVGNLVVLLNSMVHYNDRYSDFDSSTDSILVLHQSTLQQMGPAYISV